MVFQGLNEELTTEGKFAYTDATRKHIQQEFQESSLKYDDLFISIIFNRQELFPQSSSSRDGNRNLQQQEDQQPSVLRIVSDIEIKFRSENKTALVEEIVGGAFNEAEERTSYIDGLRQRGGGRLFQGITGLGVQVGGNMIKVEQKPLPETDESSNLLPVVGGIAGGIAIVVGLFLLFRRKKYPKEDITFATTKETRPGERINTDILVEPQDEVSTLGDPLYGKGMLILEKDETVTPSIVSGDYEYSRNYRVSAGMAGRERADTLQGSMGSSLKDSAGDLSSFNKMEGSIFSDDASFERQFTEIEERFEVVAPAGKLGMVIDTPRGGMPVVHAIKDTSILADRVMVGDRLISVDDIDTTGFTAMQVSRLISQKAHQETRTLMFSRTSRARNSHQQR